MCIEIDRCVYIYVYINYLGSCLECDAMNGRILEEDSRYKTPRGNLNNSDKPSGIG